MFASSSLFISIYSFCSVVNVLCADNFIPCWSPLLSVLDFTIFFFYYYIYVPKKKNTEKVDVSAWNVKD